MVSIFQYNRIKRKKTIKVGFTKKEGGMSNIFWKMYVCSKSYETYDGKTNVCSNGQNEGHDAEKQKRIRQEILFTTSESRVDNYANPLAKR